MQTRNIMLVVGGCVSLAFAVFQTSGIWWSPKAVEYLGGLAQMCATNRPLYDALCIIVAVGAAVFGFYALSGAGAIRGLPPSRTALVGVTALYFLHGLPLLPQALVFHRAPTLMPIRFLLMSAIALAVALVHLAGVVPADIVRATPQSSAQYLPDRESFHLAARCTGPDHEAASTGIRWESNEPESSEQ